MVSAVAEAFPAFPPLAQLAAPVPQQWNKYGGLGAPLGTAAAVAAPSTVNVHSVTIESYAGRQRASGKRKSTSSLVKFDAETCTGLRVPGHRPPVGPSPLCLRVHLGQSAVGFWQVPCAQGWSGRQGSPPVPSSSLLYASFQKSPAIVCQRCP